MDALQVSDGPVREQRISPSLEMEKALWARGYRAVAGLDEAGRGAWAGPVVAAAVSLPPLGSLHGVLQEVRDSKQLTPVHRERLVPLIEEVALAVGVGLASREEVDGLNVLKASCLAMRRAIEGLPFVPDYLLLDHVALPQVSVEQRSITHGDTLVLSIAAASVVAKVARDRMMVRWAEEYPGYGFERNKGYGTPQHWQALVRLGPTPLHRRTYRPVAAALETWGR